MDATISVKGALAIVALVVSTSVLAQAADVGNGAPASGNMHSDASATAGDRKLEKDVHHALGKTKHLTSIDIRVHAEAGVVTLSGSVPNRSALDRAAQATQAVPGVTAVRNNLTIENR